MKRSRLARGKEFVAPEPRDHRHVGLADPLLEFVAVAHLEALDAGRERQEALAQPIGNMGKTDRQLFLGREHESPRNSLVTQHSAQGNEPNAGLPPKRRIKFRVGTHLGIRYPVALRVITDVARPHRFGRNDPGRVKSLRGITAPGILRLVVTLRAKKCKNSSSAQRYSQIRFRFHTA
jgi:hypothetical protein